MIKQRITRKVQRNLTVSQYCYVFLFNCYIPRIFHASIAVRLKRIRINGPRCLHESWPGISPMIRRSFLLDCSFDRFYLFIDNAWNSANFITLHARDTISFSTHRFLICTPPPLSFCNSR